MKNPKLMGTSLHDCIPQTGKCPMNCNQCYFNRPGAYYYPLDQLPLLPDPEEVGDGIVRMNCGNDSNIQKHKVLTAAEKYKRVFFNTSVPVIKHFPGPVVFTANSREEEKVLFLQKPSVNLMFVRLRTSGTNLVLIDRGVDYYTELKVPVVITMMAYYEGRPSPDMIEINKYGTHLLADQCYEWKIRHCNAYWCPTPAFMQAVMARYKDNPLVSLCGSFISNYCKDCRNCEIYYYRTAKRLRGE